MIMMGVNAMFNANGGAAGVMSTGGTERREMFAGGAGPADVEAGGTGGSMRLLHGLRYLWESGLLCDAQLETEDGHRCGVHRVVLSAVSDFFRAMFTRDMQEAGTHAAICLRDIRGPILEALLRRIYTGETELTEDNIVEVTNAAAYLQLEFMLPECLDFALDALSADNCFELHNTAKTYKDRVELKELAVKLERMAFQFICEHFDDILLSGNYLKLDLETLMRCLTLSVTAEYSGIMSFGPEIELFHRVVQWCKVNQNERPLWALHYTLMTSIDLEVVKDVIQQTGFECGDVVDEAQRYSMLPMHAQVAECCHHQNKMRYQVRNQPCIVTLAHEGLYKNLRFFILSPTKCPVSSQSTTTETQQAFTWKGLLNMDQSLPGEVAAKFMPHSWVEVHGFLIILGQTTENNLCCWMFDPRTLQWSVMAAMKIARTQCPLIECDGDLFALGGVEHDGSKRISSVIERYSFVTGMWSVVGQMAVPLRGHGACSIGGKIYVYGGWQNNGRSSSAIYSYEPSSQNFKAHNSDNIPCSLHLHTVLARIYGATPYGMSHHPSSENNTEQNEHSTQGHFAVPLAESVYFIGESMEDGGHGHKSILKTRNVNRCVQVMVGEKQGVCGCTIPQPNYPKGWRPCLAVGLGLPFDLVQQGLRQL